MQKYTTLNSMKIITALTNPLIKKIVNLHTKEGRKAHNLCIVEGERAVKTFLTSPLKLETLCVTEEAYSSIAHHLALSNKIIIVSPAVMKKISTATTPSGIVGIFQIPRNPSKPLAQGIVLAQIHDPGNMGTLIRTAVALHFSTIVIVEGVDHRSPKDIQSSAGNIAHTSVYQLTWHELLQQKNACTLIALTVSNGQSLESLDTHNSLLVVGNEANGLPDAWQAQCDAKATLPMPGNTESLNAAVAGSIALYIAYTKRTKS